MTRHETAVLDAIRGGVRYGYDIGQASGVRTGRLYRALAKLEREGLIVSEWENDATLGRRRRRVYRVSENSGHV